MNDLQTVIVVGGGVAGLVAAKDLAAKGYRVVILEGNERAGGRIHTITNNTFLNPAEAGAEFIHGNLPATLSMMKEAGIPYHAIEGEMVRVSKGNWHEQHEMIMGWDEVMARIKLLEEDMTIAHFLERYFGGDKYLHTRQSIRGFAEGFDLADIDKASVFALREEWEHEEEEQHRPDDGYGKLVTWLLQQCMANNCALHTSCIVKKIAWQKNNVQVTTADGKLFEGDKVIVTVPLGVLQAGENEISHIKFEPAIPSYVDAARQMGYGSVIKVLLQFKEAFWQKRKKNIGFLITDQKIPTWWTQCPHDYPLLTGWLGGGQADKWKAVSDETILADALASLSALFDVKVTQLKEMITATHITNWRKEPFSLGAYSYNTLASGTVIKTLQTPIEDTLFFAGEALYEGPYPGTVEAAIVSSSLLVQSL
jgi:monoamine oxidase